MSKFRLFIGLLGFLSCCTVSLAQDEPAPRDEKELLLWKLAAIETFQAKFSQRLVPELGKIEDVARGEIVFTRQPQRFLWKVTSPFTQTALLEDEEMMIYEPDLEQVSYSKLDKNFQLPVAKLVLESRPEMLKDYDVSYSETQEGAASRFKLTPNGIHSVFTYVHLFFDEHRLEAVEIKDSLDNVTEFNFSAITINEAIDDDVFEVDLPPGTEVLRLSSDEDDEVP